MFACNKIRSLYHCTNLCIYAMLLSLRKSGYKRILAELNGVLSDAVDLLQHRFKQTVHGPTPVCGPHIKSCHQDYREEIRWCYHWSIQSQLTIYELYVTLIKLFNFSVPQCLHLERADNITSIRIDTKIKGVEILAKCLERWLQHC